jgi:hypothetical protein
VVLAEVAHRLCRLRAVHDWLYGAGLRDRSVLLLWNANNVFSFPHPTRIDWGRLGFATITSSAAT